MPFALLIIGAVLLISAARGTVTTGPNGGPGLFTLLESDFTGQNNFVFWFVIILVIGAIGYVPKLKPFSVAFLTLVILVLFLKRGNPGSAGGGFFAQLLQGVGTTQTATPSVSTTGGSSSSSSLLPSVSSIVNSAPGLGGLLSMEGGSYYSTGSSSSGLVPESDFPGAGTFDILPGISNTVTSAATANNSNQPSGIFEPALGVGTASSPTSDTDLSFPSLGIS
jgi:hypothetical protein